eukprot:COSAG04_NODE_19555_length_413_cov_1.054140_1_plen_20_part_10
MSGGAQSVDELLRILQAALE